jgi:exonuclease VII small subunit
MVRMPEPDKPGNTFEKGLEELEKVVQELERESS